MNSPDISYETSVEDLTDIADTYPGLPNKLVERDFLLESVEEQLERLDALFLDWPEGYGKTTLLAQFVRRNSRRTVSVFIGAPWSYQPDAVMKDICNQIHWVLNGEELKNNHLSSEDLDITSLQNRYFRKLNKRGRRKNPFYIVIDGIEDIPDRDIHAQNEIIDNLPFDAAGIKFVLSGTEETLSEYLRSKIEAESLGTILFSRQDTREYLDDLVEDKRNITEIQKTCRSIPGRLAAVRRILERGSSAESVLQLNVDGAYDLFKVEWESVQNEHDRLILALIAFSNFELRIEEISGVLSIPFDEIRSCLDRLSFVQVDEQNGTVQYVSTSFQRYAKRKLSNLESSVRDSMVDYLIGNMDNDRSLRHLPSLLSETGRHGKLLEILSPEHLYRVLRRDQSLGSINRIADLAFEAAGHQRDWGALTRFSLHKSSVAELWGNHAKRSEVEALMSLGDLEGAMALADTAFSSVERLHLLAIIARIQKDQNESVDDDLLNQIGRLSEEVDDSDLENRAEEIGADLINVDPELALRLVERGTDAGGGEHSLDVAYLKLSLAGARRSGRRTERVMSSPTTPENVQLKIQDPEARQISSKLSLLLGDYSASKVIDEAKTFDKTGDRLYFLRLWTQSHQRSEDAGTVIEYALKQVVQNVDYAHDAGLLRGLAEPLPYLESEEKIRKLVDIFDQQKQSSLLVEELVRLEILLARAEAKFDIETADDRLTRLYFELQEVDDLATRTEGWARLLAALPLADPVNPEEESILKEVSDDLERSTADLLSKSADQIDATRHVIRGLASNRPDEAIEITGRLNTENRRNQAILEFIGAYLDSHIRDVQLDVLFRAIEKLESAPAHQKALSKIFDRLSGEQENILTAANYVDRFSGEMKKMYCANERCEAAVQGYSVVLRACEQREDYETEAAEDLLKEAKESFEALDNRFDKIEKAFHIAAQLADVDRETAIDFMEKAEDLRSRVFLEDWRSRNVFFASLDLTIRAYRGLIIGETDDVEDLSRIIDLVEKMESIEDRIRCLSDLAFAFFRGERSESGKDIVREHIRPLLNQISDDDKRRCFEMWSYAAPPLYMTGRKRTLNEIGRNLSDEYRDYALSNIADAILDRVMPSEPVDTDPNRNCKINTEEIYELIELLEIIEADYINYRILEQIVKSILDDEGRRKYDKTFRIDIENKLRNILKDSFPHRRYIQHDGYRILGKADLLLLKDTYKQVGAQSWIDLLEEARSIDNEADRAFVLSKLVKKHPSSKGRARKRRLNVLDEVEDIIQEIPSVLDRLERFDSLARAAKEVDKSRARTYHKKAIQLLYDERDNVSSSKGKKIQRRIVSSAYRIDPDFASSLSNLADDDPAHQQELQRNIKRLRRRESISTSGSGHQDEPDPDFPNVCWESLGSLNAGRLPSGVRKERARDILKKARGYPLEGAYPIQTFITEGLVRTYRTADESSKVIRPVFEANLQNAHLVERLAARSSKKQDQAKAQAAEQAERPQTFSIGKGEREKGLRILQNWIAESVTNRLIICDQYFGPGEIDVLSLIQSVAPDCEIEILSSEKHHRQEGVENLREAYTEAWRDKYDQEIPALRIIVAGMSDEGGKSPVHDRWWLADGSGLRLGTSFNGLGKVQTSEISLMDGTDHDAKVEEVEQYLSTRAREVDGTQISYRVENL